VSEWILFLHPPRDDFKVTLTEAEVLTFGAHSEWLQGLVADGSLILAGPCLGGENTGILIFEAEARKPLNGSSRRSP
jgi:uncharacterized protein YciI